MPPVSSTRSAVSMTAAPRPTRWRWNGRRGITIKSAVVSFVVDDVTVNLIDTPGHPDFIAEVERVLSVLDGAVLVVSAVEGVQAQTRVLMRTLQRLRIPTLIFVNKIDRSGADYERVLAGHLREADARSRRDGIGARAGHAQSPTSPRTARRTPRSRAGWPSCWPTTTTRFWPRTSTRRRRFPTATSARELAGADQAGAGASGVLRLGDHRRRRGRADRRHHRVAAGGRGRCRRPGLGHRLQGRTRCGRREDRLRADVLGHGANARSAAASRADNEAKVTAISVFDRGSAVRASVRRGRADRQALGSRRCPDRRHDRRRRDTAPSCTTSPRRPWKRSSSLAAAPTRARCTPRWPSLPSRTR